MYFASEQKDLRLFRQETIFTHTRHNLYLLIYLRLIGMELDLSPYMFLKEIKAAEFEFVGSLVGVSQKLPLTRTYRWRGILSPITWKQNHCSLHNLKREVKEIFGNEGWYRLR